MPLFLGRTAVVLPSRQLSLGSKGIFPISITNIRFICYNQGNITPIQRSFLFFKKFPDVILDKKQLQRILAILNYIINLQDLYIPLNQRLRNKNTQSIKQIKIYAKEIPYLCSASPLAFKIVETNTDIGYGSNLKQLVDNKEQLMQLPALYYVFYIICLIPPNSILTKDINKLFQDCRKLYLLFKANQIHYQSPSPIEIENRNLTHRLLQEKLKTHLASLCAFKKFLACETIEFYLCVHENTFYSNHSMHKRKNFPKTFICKTIFLFVLQEMKSIEATLSPTEIKKNMSDTLSPTKIKKNINDTL
ncbi:hypothetical protein CFOL_v3_06275 [Cephalotus follicularis]|uniref:Uncharacterized protein n=1 Tax=Cephalotus follicularis TaxID=3775 RepID=A0A1Q3B4R6_CEPFO|nr:hypothetical protein CFOL_v3_06275 [Cephalotus follicularis]